MKMTKLPVAPLLGAFLLVASAAHGETAEPTSDEGPAFVPLAGFNDGFYLRDSHDNFRLYPRGRLNLDWYSSMGPGVSEVKATDGSAALAPRLLLRRARLELGGNFFKERIAFFASVDFGGQPLSNTDGKTQQSFAKAGEAPSSSSAKFAAVQS